MTGFQQCRVLGKPKNSLERARLWRPCRQPYVDASQPLLDYYDAHLAKHGDTAHGAAWPDEAGRQARFAIGLELIRMHAGDAAVTVCDLGCGTGEFYRYLRDAAETRIAYVGLDRSAQAIALAREKFPEATFECVDLEHCADDVAARLLNCDFVFANGLFTVRHTLSHQAMWDFLQGTLERAWAHVRRGVVFNVMSKIVDWERDDLFHVSYDAMAGLLRGLGAATTGFQAQRDLYEYMAYALKPAPATMETPQGTPIIDAQAVVPVCRPLLPPAAALAPYLRRIDMARRYTNHGSLADALTAALAVRMGTEGVCLASSGTAALTGAIFAMAGRATAARPLALCPSYTFVATALAAQLAGYEPVLVDVDRDTWTLTPEIVAAQCLDRVGVVVVAAPYGGVLPNAAWAAFMAKTGVPVVIDAAAAFENACSVGDDMIGDVPIVLSLHATKAFSTGEGGAVVCRQRGVIERTYAALNFGFLAGRACASPGLNGKISEYHAAVGLAELDGWPAKREAWARMAMSYRAAATAHGLHDRIDTAPRVASCYALFMAADAAEADAVEAELRRAVIDSRRWYGAGLHREVYFSDRATPPLPGTTAVASRIIGLPVAPDLPRPTIDRIVAAIARGVEAHARRSMRNDGRNQSA
jgi:dTDP-4-amino-4,6-dideoxygalactose transaminase/SAM-dependent methyltransferase